MVNKITTEELKILKKSGLILSSALKLVRKYVKPGMPTLSLDKIVETELRRLGAQPSFKSYQPQSDNPYPAATCISINDEVVHGLPKNNKVLKNGDIVSIDIGGVYKGMYTDMAMTFPVGQISESDKKLIDVAKEALEKGIKQVKSGKKTGDIGAAIETHATINGFSVVKDLVGHGVGHQVHEDPPVPNFGKAGTGTILEAGMGLAIEPMLNQGKSEVIIQKDGWTVLTKDGRKSAHFEKTVVVTGKDPIIITPFY